MKIKTETETSSAPEIKKNQQLGINTKQYIKSKQFLEQKYNSNFTTAVSRNRNQNIVCSRHVAIPQLRNFCSLPPHALTQLFRAHSPLHSRPQTPPRTDDNMALTLVSTIIILILAFPSISNAQDMNFENITDFGDEFNSRFVFLKKIRCKNIHCL